MEEAGKMIDLHNHILSGRDDGAETLEESIRMCRIGYQDGIRTIVATPHILPGIYKNDRSTILSQVAELNNALREFGILNTDPITQFLNDAACQGPPSALRHPHSLRARGLSLRGRCPSGAEPEPEAEFRILPGADVHFSSDLLERLKKEEIVTVNDQGRYLMIEFAFQGIPYQAEEALFQLMSNGIIPIISHPERNMEIEQRPQRYYEMIRMGCLGQVTAMSLTGEFGPEIKRSAEKLLTKRLLHFIASDAHSPNRRPPILSVGVKAAEKIVGKEEARKMVTEYPKAVLEGHRPDAPQPLSP